MIPASQTRRRRPARIVVRITLFVGVMLVIGIVAVKVSPWPSVFIIRYTFNQGGEKANAGLANHVPPGVGEIRDISYEETDPAIKLDFYFPNREKQAGKILPLIVWIHGGGWVAGSKDHVANYCRIMASLGYAVASIDYSLAPGALYPTPVRQSHDALAYLVAHADSMQIDPSRIFLAGDSGGAHIASQVAVAAVNSAYADKLGVTPSISGEQLRGVLLFCGPYSITQTPPGGRSGWFVNSVLWAYSGDRNFKENKFFATASVLDYVDSSFPPTFITVGNGDMLEPQSRQLTRRLTASGVDVDSMFYDPTYTPKLKHEYQFNLDSEEGRSALERIEEFLVKNSMIMI